MIFAAIWTIICLCSPIAHMVWGGGYLFNEGALDLGGTVVHMNGGLTGLVLALLIGKRAGYSKVAMKPVVLF